MVDAILKIQITVKMSTVFASSIQEKSYIIIIISDNICYFIFDVDCYKGGNQTVNVLRKKSTR